MHSPIAKHPAPNPYLPPSTAHMAPIQAPSQSHFPNSCTWSPLGLDPFSTTKVTLSSHSPKAAVFLGAGHQCDARGSNPDTKPQLWYGIHRGTCVILRALCHAG